MRLKATIESDEMHRSGHADFLAWHQASLMLRTVRLWEQPLPAPRHGRIGILPSASIGLLQPAMALSQIPLLDLPHWLRRCKGRNRRSQAPRACGAGGRQARPTRTPINIRRADSPWLAISCAMVWIVLGAWDRHLALLLGSVHWP